jgi:ABC-type uncharacterized transport system substrate-binding protein
MRRREFIAGIGSVAAWPLATRAQPAERMRRIGVLLPWSEDDPSPKTWLSAFVTAFAELGWTDGRNVRMDLRWAGGDINRIRALAQELVGLQPDIIVTDTTPACGFAKREARGGIPQRAERNGLRRWPERRDRVPLGGGSKRSTAMLDRGEIGRRCVWDAD